MPPHGHATGYLLALNLARRPASLASACAYLGVLRRSAAPLGFRFICRSPPAVLTKIGGRTRYGGSSSVVEFERSQDREREGRLSPEEQRGTAVSMFFDRSKAQRSELPSSGIET